MPGGSGGALVKIGGGEGGTEIQDIRRVNQHKVCIQRGALSYFLFLFYF